MRLCMVVVRLTSRARAAARAAASVAGCPEQAIREFKLARFFPDSDAQDAQSVRSCAATCWPMLPTFCPTNDQGPATATGDQALDLLLLQ
jgi:hypothetical protein